MYSGDCIDGKIEVFYVCSLKEDNCPYKKDIVDVELLW